MANEGFKVGETKTRCTRRLYDPKNEIQVKRVKFI